MSNKQIQHFSTVWDVIDDKDSNDGGASDVDNTDGNDCVGGCGGDRKFWWLVLSPSGVPRVSQRVVGI